MSLPVFTHQYVNPPQMTKKRHMPTIKPASHHVPPYLFSALFMIFFDHEWKTDSFRFAVPDFLRIFRPVIFMNHNYIKFFLNFFVKTSPGEVSFHLRLFSQFSARFDAENDLIFANNSNKL